MASEDPRVAGHCIAYNMLIESSGPKTKILRYVVDTHSKHYFYAIITQSNPGQDPVLLHTVKSYDSALEQFNLIEWDDI
jgi:hypothetical protein